VKRLIGFILPLVLIFSLLPGLSGTAADIGRVTLGVQYNGTLFHNATASNLSDRYTVVLDQPGRLRAVINSTALPGNARVEWRSADGVFVDWASTALDTNPYDMSVDLEAGIYMIDVISRRTGTADFSDTYNFTATATHADYNELECNNTLATAQLLATGQTVRAYLSYQDDIDIFRYDLARPGRLTVTVTGGSSGILLPQADIEWKDSNGVKMIGGHADFTALSNGRYSEFMDLEAGTYYIQISRRARHTGTYTLTGVIISANNNEVEPNNSLGMAQTLSPGQTVRGYLTYQDDVDIFRYVLPRAGRMTVNVTRDAAEGTRFPNWGANVRWLDSRGAVIGGSSSGFNFPYNGSMDLAAGTYFIEITGVAGANGRPNTGTYNLVVNDLLEQFDINVEIVPEAGGSAEGSGRYSSGASVTLRAIPQSGYRFEGWYEGGEQVESGEIFRFTAERDRSLQARFVQGAAPSPSPGASPSPSPSPEPSPSPPPEVSPAPSPVPSPQSPPSPPPSPAPPAPSPGGPTLPQTGMPFWPVFLPAALGLPALIIGGLMTKRKRK